MQNRCKKKACKKYGTWCENASKMGAKIHPTSEKYQKNCIRKLMPKFDAPKIKTFRQPHFSYRFWIDFLAVPGDRGAEDTWKYQIDSNNLTRSPPWWGVADNMAPKTDLKSMKNRGCVAEVYFTASRCSPGAVTLANSGVTWRHFSVKNKKHGMQICLPMFLHGSAFSMAHSTLQWGVNICVDDTPLAWSKGTGETAALEIHVLATMLAIHSLEKHSRKYMYF